MQIELDEADERSLARGDSVLSESDACAGLTVDVSPDDVLRALVRREAEDGLTRPEARAFRASFDRPGALARGYGH